MASPHAFSFAVPAMPGDALALLVLVEDSAQMAAKWPDVRDSYLPLLLEHLRAADPSVQIEARWLTTSSSFPVALHAIADPVHCRTVPDLALGHGPDVKISPAAIQNAIQILASSLRGTSATRHFVLVAATGPLASSPMSEATPSGFDPWDDIALVLKQENIRLHVILNIGAEMRTYHELFKRSLQLQSNSEVPAWFPVDSRRFSIRLSGRPQYVRSSVAAPIPLIPAGIHQGRYGNPSSPLPPSKKSASPSTPPMQQDSPPPAASPHHRKAATSPTAPRSRGRGSETSNSPPESGGGLVSYLQQMHGLTKKKSYGVKAPKKTYSDIHLPIAGRPILPRLEVPQSEIYSYPSFDSAHGPEPQVLVSDAQSPPSRRHSADQLPPASLVARTTNDDRRARRRGPWLPIAPLVSSTPSSPTSVTSPSTLAALQSLASMTPRLPDFVTKGRAQLASDVGPGELQDSYAAHVNAGSADAHAYVAHAVMGVHSAESHAPYPASSPPQDPQLTSSPTYYYSRVPGAGGGAPQWSQQQGSVGASPASSASAPSPSHTSASGFSDTSRAYGSDFAYGSSPPSSAAVTPLSLAAPARLPENAEDQPFIITAEIVAKSDADMAEVVRSGALQASMSPALCGAMQPAMAVAPAPRPPMYAPPPPPEPPSPDHHHLYYSALGAAAQVQGHSVHAQEHAYHVYQPEDVHMGTEYAVPHADDGQWQYGGGVHAGYVSHVPEYIPPQGHWYPS
ncbi:hypothetical protein C8Q77DRAFT_1218892 [Trametes polyzona]|nr:hypothetical protein C8Q77DRAFT_1218892 [Trametes polyzona]